MLPALSYRGIDLETTTSGDLHDEFVQTADTTTYVVSGSGSGFREAVSQSWDSGADPLEVTGVVLRLFREGEVEGSFRAHIYAHSGTYGSSSVPTGQPLVTSKEYAADAVATSATNYWFPMSGWTPSASTDYCVVIEHSIPFANSSNHRIRVVTEDGAEATHGGNAAILNSTWSAQATIDMAFKIYYAAAGGGGGDDFELRLRDGTYRRRYGGMFR